MQLPRFDQWLSYCETVLPFFVGRRGAFPGEVERAYSQLKAYCELDLR